jgi:hypothetical protein
MEGKMTALDLTELVDQHVAIRKPPVTDKERVVDTVSV